MSNLKKNNKGFMLVEIVVVTVVVVTVMTTLYVLFNRVYNAFELKSTYSNIDAIYALDLLRDHLIETEVEYNSENKSFMYNEIINYIHGYINDSSINGYIEIKKDMINTLGVSLEEKDKFENYIDSVFENYNVSKAYIVACPFSNDNNPLLKLKEHEEINQTFKEYIEHLGESYDDFRNSKGAFCDDKNNCYTEIFLVEIYSNDEKDNVSNQYSYLHGRILEGV